MLKELLQERNKLLDRIENQISKWNANARADLISVLKNYDNNVLWKYLDSKEVNSQLLEELKFYEK